MHRHDLDSPFYLRIGVVASVFRLSTRRTDQHPSHRHSGTRYCHTQSFEPLSWCHLIFLSTFLRRPDEPFGGTRNGWRESCRLLYVRRLPAVKSTLCQILGRRNTMEIAFFVGADFSLPC